MHMKNREKHRIAQEEKKKNLLIAGAVVKEKKITNKQTTSQGDLVSLLHSGYEKKQSITLAKRSRNMISPPFFFITYSNAIP